MAKTRFNFISETGDGFGFAQRCLEEGNEVRLWIRDPAAKSIGDNLVAKPGSIEDMLLDASPDNDVFIFDTTGNGIIADFLRKKRFPVLGDSILADRLERDRSFGASVMERAQISIPQTLKFTSFEDGRKFVAENEETRWVYKPSKELGDLSPSHVSYDAEDLIELLTNVESEVDIAEPQFELQEFIKGVPISTELWFKDGELIPLTNHTLERKELMNGDIGPSGGCTGNIVWFCDGCAICNEVNKLVPVMRKLEYNGMIDLNAIANTEGFYGLEFTPRFGYDASPTMLWKLFDGHYSELSNFLADAARHQLRSIDLQSGIAGGLRVTIPPWPTEKHHAEENVPIRGLEEKYQENCYLYNVKADQDGQICTSGAWGIICIFIGFAETIRGCLSQPEEAAKKVRVKNKQFRTDLVKSFEEDVNKLKAAMGMGVGA